MIESLRLKWISVGGYDMLGKSTVKPHRVAELNIHPWATVSG
jgi:hypothetical protein